MASPGPLTHRHFDVSLIRKTFPDFKFTELRDGLSMLLTAALKEAPKEQVKDLRR